MGLVLLNMSNIGALALQAVGILVHRPRNLFGHWVPVSTICGYSHIVNFGCIEVVVALKGITLVLRIYEHLFE